MTFNPRLWASPIPRDPREQKPNHYWQMARVAWWNRDQLPYAWYDRAGYDLRIDYGQPPETPLSVDDMGWARERLAATKPAL